MAQGPQLTVERIDKFNAFTSAEAISFVLAYGMHDKVVARMVEVDADPLQEFSVDEIKSVIHPRRTVHPEPADTLSLTNIGQMSVLAYRSKGSQHAAALRSLHWSAVSYEVETLGKEMAFATALTNFEVAASVDGNFVLTSIYPTCWFVYRGKNYLPVREGLRFDQRRTTVGICDPVDQGYAVATSGYIDQQNKTVELVFQTILARGEVSHAHIFNAGSCATALFVEGRARTMQLPARDAAGRLIVEDATAIPVITPFVQGCVSSFIFWKCQILKVS